MPRAKRYPITGYIRHITHRCHKRELQKEKDSKITISKATAKGAVTSIFTIASDF